MYTNCICVWCIGKFEYQKIFTYSTRKIVQWVEYLPYTRLNWVQFLASHLFSEHCQVVADGELGVISDLWVWHKKDRKYLHIIVVFRFENIK